MNDKLIIKGTGKHDLLKEIGKNILIGLGIPSNIIKEEITVDCDKKYRVDLKGNNICIECGKVDNEKIINLRNSGYDVLCLPYSFLEKDTYKQFSDKIEDMGREITLLRSRVHLLENQKREEQTIKPKEDIKQHFDEKSNLEKVNDLPEVNYLPEWIREYKKHCDIIKNSKGSGVNG